MARERQLHRRGEDPQLARSRSSTKTVSEKPRSAAIAWRCVLRDRGAVEKHPERVAAAAVLGAEDAQDVSSATRVLSGGSGGGR